MSPETDNIIALIAAGLSIAVLIFAAGFHFYWAFGGQVGRSISVPERLDGLPLLAPSTTMTNAVGLGLLSVVGLVILSILHLQIAQSLLKTAMGLCIVAFLGRAISWHTYFGLFKSVRSTRFGRYDTWLYSPLCLVIGLSLLVLFAKL